MLTTPHASWHLFIPEPIHIQTLGGHSKLKLCAPCNEWEAEAQSEGTPHFPWPSQQKHPISSRFRWSLGRARVSQSSTSPHNS